MPSLAELQTRVETLRALRAEGTLHIREGDRDVTYRSDAELGAAIADLERQITAAIRGPVHTVRISSSKGL